MARNDKSKKKQKITGDDVKRSPGKLKIKDLDTDGRGVKGGLKLDYKE
jgi:hypothetical protein